MAEDLLEKVSWWCASVAPGEVEDPSQLGERRLDWVPVTIPGTAAGALRDAGRDVDGIDFDASDWWFRCTFPSRERAARHRLCFEGLATLCDVWLNGLHVLRSEDMFLRSEVEVDLARDENELVLRFASTEAFLSERRGRPRWRTYLVAHPNQRWLRSTLMGRLPGWVETPAPVGPWRPIRLLSGAEPRVAAREVRTRVVGTAGEIAVRLLLEGLPAAPRSVSLASSGQRATLQVRSEAQGWWAEGILRIEDVELWWPHTHGRQPLYEVELDLDGTSLELGRVGFKTIEVDRADNGFTLIVNGEEVFCRGAVWMPLDPVTFNPSPEEMRRALGDVRAANMNMVRLPGTGVYEDSSFWDCCDEFGILVWQDCLFAFSDPPTAPDFVDAFVAEVRQVLGDLGGRAALAVVSGSQEVESQAAMLATPRSKWGNPLFEETLPGVVAQVAPGIPYVSSNPSGGDVPFQMDVGTSHFFGVGGYMGDLKDTRRANVRFATECLSFGIPPERFVMDDEWRSSAPAGHDPEWKSGVHRDTGRSWDLEDALVHYVHTLFDIDPLMLRWRDPDRYQDLSRAAAVTAMSEVMSEWRRPESSCAGGLVLAARDLRRGGGWGLVDYLGRPKAPWYALRRCWQPVALLLTNEVWNGLHLHVVNDTADALRATIEVSLYSQGELLVDRGAMEIEVAARRGSSVRISELFSEWWDFSYAFGFGRPAFDVVAAALRAPSGEVLSEAFHFPAGLERPIEPDVGLAATLTPCGDARWRLEVSTRRFAQWVVVEVPGYVPEDSWFHLAPRSTRSIVIEARGSSTPPVGSIRALNSSRSAKVIAGP